MERVQLPDPVKRIIEERAEQVGFPALKRAASAMSDAYREGRSAALSRLPAAERTAAYLATRMPATYAASLAVLREVRERLNGPIGSILDIGAGTGAASLAARQCFPEAAVTLLERDSAFAEAARAFLPDARILSADAANLEPLPPHDLVIAAYSLGELASTVTAKSSTLVQPLADARGSDRSRDREGAVGIQRFWQAARVALIVIEPGTPVGFTLIRNVRDSLLSTGAHMLAPCPAETACPIVEPDWCHFAARVERSSLHRRLKDGQLSYEDEKFSYIALGRNQILLPVARIIRHPQHQPGLITLETCTAEGLRSRRVTKRDKDAFRIARKSSWGDAVKV